MTARVAAQRRASAPDAAPRGVLQRKCACGTHTGGGACAACAGEKERDKPLQRSAAAPTHDPGVTPAVRAVLAAPGEPLPAAARASLEPLFAADFSRVRVHTGAAAAESAREVAADAYTVGHDVVFAHGRYAPETPAGRKLLAHELTHVVQQRAGLHARASDGPSGEAHERQADTMGERAAAAAAAPRFIVDDETERPAPGQLRKSDLLARLRPAVCRAADAELARVGRDTRGCPYLERAFERYAALRAEPFERALRRFAPESAGAGSAEELVPHVAARVAASVARWVETGALPTLPGGVELDALAPAGLFGSLASLAGPFSGLLGGLGRLFFKTQPGAPPPAPNAGGAAALAAGTPLDSGVRQQMSSALGRTLPDVRVHTGAGAAALNTRLGSRAFTLGRHIAFGQGEYQPGTPVGDALLAHELAHVVQQGAPVAAETPAGAAPPAPSDAALEADADDAAAGAVVSIWGRTQRGFEDLRRKTGPRLKSGLRLQMSRCGGGHAAAGRTTTPAAAARTCATSDAAAWSAAVTRARGTTELEARAGAMAALVEEALCPLGRTVHTAGTAHTDTVHPDDYQAQPVVNFDVRLNSKTAWASGGRGGTVLTNRVGYNFTASGTGYVVLGPQALDENTPLQTRLYADHEQYMVTHAGSFPPGTSRADIELDTWTEDFRGYFHQYMTLTPRPRWTPLAGYYRDASGNAKTRALDRLVDYFNHPPVSGTDLTTFRRAFENWMRHNPSELVTDLDARLHVLAPAGGGTP